MSRRPFVKKASQSSSPAGDEAIKIMFSGGPPQGGFSCPCGAIHLLYVGEHTYCRKSPQGFSDSWLPFLLAFSRRVRYNTDRNHGGRRFP